LISGYESKLFLLSPPSLYNFQSYVAPLKLLEDKAFTEVKELQVIAFGSQVLKLPSDH
jgi:hypothetical protein